MQNNENLNTQNVSATAAEIHILDLLKLLWGSRRLILAVTLSVAACVFAGSLYFARYKSEGFLQFGGPIPIMKEKELSLVGKEKELSQVAKEKEPSPGISLSDYKRYAALYLTNERFADFVRDKKPESSAAIDSLSGVFASRDGIAKLIDPIYPFTKLDAKELMDQPKDGSNNVIGLRINFAGSSPENAQRVVGQLGSYVMDSIIYQIYSDELQFKQGELIARITKLDNFIIANKELLQKYHRKGADLKQIVSRYPESSGHTSGQVISVTEDSARYLSPITLLATTEVQASEANESIYKAKRELQQSALWREYYDHVKMLLDKTKSGETIVRSLDMVKESVFKGKNLGDDAIKEVFNTITIDNQNAINVYLEKSRFIAGPSFPVYSSMRPLFALAMGLTLGLLLSISLVFAQLWWRDNWKKVSGGKS